MKRRLIAVQGPLQYITANVAASWIQSNGAQAEAVEDVLLMYDFLSSPEIEKDIADSVLQLACHSPWARVVYITGAEMDALVRGRYTTAISTLHQRLGTTWFDEIYLARDHVGHGSPLLMNAYSGATKLQYGDSLGIVGQRAVMAQFEESQWGKWPARLRSQTRKILLGGPKPIPFDAAVLTLPIDMSSDYLASMRLVVPPRHHLVACIERISGEVKGLQEYCNKLVAKGTSPEDKLYLLSNLAASRLSTAQLEADLYIDVILEQSAPGSTVYLKAHPRSSLLALNTVIERLGDRHQLVVLDDPRFARIPIELWVGLLHHCQVVALFSTSAINLKYLFDTDVSLPLDPHRIQKYFIESCRKFMGDANALMHASIANLDTWDRQSPLWVQAT